MILPRRLQFTRAQVPHSVLSSAPFLVGKDAALLLVVDTVVDILLECFQSDIFVILLICSS